MFIKTPANKNAISKRRPLQGVGVNDAYYLTQYHDDNGKLFTCRFYRTWSNMIFRSYAPSFKAKNPTYSDCEVSVEWLLFSNFKSWMEKQNWQNRELDKDVLESGNKLYSSKTCIFIPREINALLVGRDALRGEFPKGVSFDKSRRKYASGLSVNGKRKGLGRYKTPEEAEDAYKQFKSKHILEVAEEYKDEPRLYEALQNHAKLMLLQSD